MATQLLKKLRRANANANANDTARHGTARCNIKALGPGKQKASQPQKGCEAFIHQIELSAHQVAEMKNPIRSCGERPLPPS